MSYRSLLKSERFQAFLAELRDRRDEQTVLMRSESDTVRLFRAQGAADALDSLLSYPEEQALIEEKEAEAAAEAAREDQE